MFKEENRIWWYIVGLIIALVFFAIFAQDYFIPVLLGQRDVFSRQEFLYDTSPAFTIDVARDYQARFVTNLGVVTVDLYEDFSPLNVNNFVFLAEKGYYDGTRFHRLIPDFLVQGGDRNSIDDDPLNDGRGGPGYLVRDEINWDALDLPQPVRDELTSQGYSSTPSLESQALRKYTLAMASSAADTNGAQFFFLLAANDDPRLELFLGKFTTIGSAVGGIDVLERMRAVPVDDPTSDNPRPTQDIVLEFVEIVKL